MCYYVVEGTKEAMATASRARKKTAATTEGTAPSTEQIAQRAYEIWERDGYIDGRHEDHWFLAIAELTTTPTTE